MATTPAAPVAPTTQDVDMMADVAEVNEQITEVRERIARIEGQLPHLATKADLADATTRLERAVRRQTYWLVGTLIAVGGLIFAAIKLL